MEEKFNESKVSKVSFFELLKRIGPGIILAGVVIGPGNITTSAMIGSEFGYSLVWLVIPIAFMGVTFMLTSYRVSMLTGMPVIHAVRKYYGKGAAAIVGIATFLSCLFFTMGNISGAGAGANLVFGIDWKIGSLIVLLVTLVCYFTKGVYSIVEKIITICIIGMIICFLLTLVATGGPNPNELGSGLVTWGFPDGSLSKALAYISTNAAITAGIYGTYLGAEKKWKKEDLFNGIMFTDAITHILSVILISGSIMLVGAVVLHPTGTVITAPAQLGELLVPFLGSVYAPIIMGIALLAAGFSSLLGNTQRGMVLLAAGIDKPVGLESKFIKYGCLICLVVTAIICYSYGGSPTQLILMANIATAVATPFGGFFVLRLLLNEDVNKGLKQPKILQICMFISYVFALVMTFSAIIGILQKIF